MIFDRDPMVRQLLWVTCDRRGYETSTSPDPCLCPLGAEGGCPCDPAARCADVIIADLAMPAVKALDFVEAQMGNGCHCRHIALLSGAWSDDDMAHARDLGCTLFFHMSQLSEWLGQIERSLSPNRMLHDGRPRMAAAVTGQGG